MYINDLNIAIPNCKVYHFADDTNLLSIGHSIKKLNKLVNKNLKHLTNWLNANKISINASKTELVFFKPKRKFISFNLKVKLGKKRIFPSDSVKYLGVKIDKQLNWKTHVNDIAIKLIRANAMLFKIRDNVNASTLKSIYYAIFESHINYACTVWGQNNYTINRLFILQKKALRTLFYKDRNAHSNPLFLESGIIKLPDKVKIENCLLISKYVHNTLPSSFYSWFTFSSTSHRYETSFSSQGNLKIPNVQTTSYGKASFISMAVKSWNNLLKDVNMGPLASHSPNKLKIVLKIIF